VLGKRKLAKGGTKAKAVVTKATREGGAPMNLTWTPVQYRLELQVRFEDGSTAETSCRTNAAMRGTELSFSEGDIVPVLYDPADRTKIALDEATLKTYHAGRSEAFKAAAVVRGELELSALAADEARSSPPTDAELQAASDAWDAARAKAGAGLEAYKQAKAAGDSSEAARHLREGAVHNAEQEVLGKQFKRLKAMRPDWKGSTDA